jgi:hypothetical protein
MNNKAIMYGVHTMLTDLYTIGKLVVVINIHT